MEDIRDRLFQGIAGKRFRAVLTAERAGVLSGREAAEKWADQLGVELELCKASGADIGRGERIGSLTATAKQMALAEEALMGTMAKASGIASAARTAVLLADGKVQIVSGSWKKMPPEVKGMVRRAVADGGASFRITEPPMLYLDKNFLRMLGGIPAALAACDPFPGHTKVVQIRSEDGDVKEETGQAAAGGADILMVDTGRTEDLEQCIAALRELGARERVKVAFAGNVKLADIPALADRGADILCIGKEIVDAQLLDMKLDVVGEV